MKKMCVCVCIILDTLPQVYVNVLQKYALVSMCPEETVSAVTLQLHTWTAQSLNLCNIRDFSRLRYLKKYTLRDTSAFVFL